MNTPIIQLNHVSHRFKRQLVLDDISLAIPRGSVYGLLGPNGAGKTTTLRLILGLLQLQEGRIALFGNELTRHRLSILRKTGSLIEQPSLYHHLTASENLEVCRMAYQCEKKRIGEILHLTGLATAGRKKVQAFSLGMKQRLALGIALLHDPELLILDEPTNGLDPGGIIETRDLIRKLNRECGKTILVSSHLLDEVEKMATDVAIIHRGCLMFQGTMEELRTTTSGSDQLELEVSEPQQAAGILAGVANVRVTNGRLIVDVANRDSISLVNETLVRHDIKVYHLSSQQKDLESLFVQIISEKR